MTNRINSVTKIIGTLFLGLLFCLIVFWTKNEKMTDKVYLFTFLLATNLVLIFEKFISLSKWLEGLTEDDDEGDALTIYFLIPIILTIVLAVYLLIGTFTKMRGYYWLVTLLEFCSISLLYSNQIWMEIFKKENKNIEGEGFNENNQCDIEEEICDIE